MAQTLHPAFFYSQFIRKELLSVENFWLYKKYTINAINSQKQSLKVRSWAEAGPALAPSCMNTRVSGHKERGPEDSSAKET